MFENAKPPEDMFAGTETGTAPPLPPMAGQPPPPAAPPPMTPAMETASRSGFPWKPVLIGVGAIVVVGGAASISYALLASRAPAAPVVPAAVTTTPMPATTTTTTAKPTVTPTTAVPPVTTTAEPNVPTTVPVDRDKDGLTDDEEASLGTDPTKADTDADGLFDAEEANTYKTDPLNPDTDGDTYLDGAEVKAGYNPNGSGKLFSVPGA